MTALRRSRRVLWVVEKQLTTGQWVPLSLNKTRVDGRKDRDEWRSVYDYRTPHRFRLARYVAEARR